VSSTSILIPTYNAAATVAETLVSVQSQTALSELQAVYLADDGSIDTALCVVQKVCTAQTPLRVLRTDSNLGQWPNVNRAMQKIRADKHEWGIRAAQRLARSIMTSISVRACGLAVC
jgi:glycosyltransferase involved in cell wall biosynthesis